MIVHASKDENNKYKGGKAGDQTGKEVCKREWYNRPWNVVLEPPTAKLGNLVARKAKAAANNNKIGYNQSDRNSIFKALEEANNEFKKITKPCNCDCSSLVTAVVISAQKDDTKEKMMHYGNASTTRTLVSDLKKCGWIIHRDRKYLSSDQYLGEGWIMVYEGHHAAINVNKGDKYDK